MAGGRRTSATRLRTCRAALPGVHERGHDTLHVVPFVRDGLSTHWAQFCSTHFVHLFAQIAHRSRTDSARLLHRIRGQPPPHQTLTSRA